MKRTEISENGKLLIEISFFNNCPVRIENEFYNSIEIMYKESRGFPRKKKKKLRKLLFPTHLTRSAKKSPGFS